MEPQKHYVETRHVLPLCAPTPSDDDSTSSRTANRPEQCCPAACIGGAPGQPQDVHKEEASKETRAREEEAARAYTYRAGGGTRTTTILYCHQHPPEENRETRWKSIYCTAGTLTVTLDAIPQPPFTPPARDARGSVDSIPFWRAPCMTRSLRNTNAYSARMARAGRSRTLHRKNGTIEFAKPKDKATYANVSAVPESDGVVPAVVRMPPGAGLWCLTKFSDSDTGNTSPFTHRPVSELSIGLVALKSKNLCPARADVLPISTV